MGRRILAFFLGMIFGIIFLVGSLAGGLLIMATVIKPADLSAESSKYLGDLAQLSLLDIYKSVSELYRNKVGVTDAEGKYYTFGEFCENYHINPNDLFGGKEVPQEVLDVPIFELIGGDRDQAQNQIRVSVIPALLNMFMGGGTGEDGSANAMFPDSVLEKLSAYSIVDLKGEGGIATVFSDVRIAEVAMGMLPLERTDDNAMMWAVGQAKLGPILGGIDGNVLLQFLDGGAFDEMGRLPLVSMLGNSSQILNAFLKNKAIADMIDAEGNLNPDTIINSVYLGEIVGLQRDELSEEETETFWETGISSDTLTLLENDEQYALRTEDGTFSAKQTCNSEEEDHVHDINCFGFVWYSTTATEEGADTDLVLEDGRYPLATGIYAAIADVTIGSLTGGDSNALVDKLMDVPLNELLEGQEMSGIFANISDMTIGELINGGIDNMYLGDLLGFKRNEISAPEGDILPLYKSEPHEDGDKPVKYVVMNEDGTVAGLSPDGKVWYEGEITCAKEVHEHTAECGVADEEGNYPCGKEQHAHDVAGCYGYVWYEKCEEAHEHEGELVIDDEHYVRAEGMMAKISDKQISELSDLDDLIKELTLADVLGKDVPDILKGLKDVPIGELNDAINDLYLGELLSFRRRPLSDDELAHYDKTVQDIEGKDIEGILAKQDEDGNITGNAKLDGEVWYEAQFNCIDDEHKHDEACYDGEGQLTCTIEEHAHDANCYGYVWYEKCEEAHEHDGEWLPVEDNDEGNYYVPAGGMMGKLADEQVKNLGKLDETAKKLTLADVLGDDIPAMLKSLKDTPIGKLDTAIDTLYLGQLLEYRRKDSSEIADFETYTTDVVTDEAGNALVRSNGDGKYVRADGKVWYEAQLTCTDEEHTHSDECYDAEGNIICGKEEHAHDETCYGYVWYKKCEESHEHEGEWVPVEDNQEGDRYIVADGMMGKLANEQVKNLGNLNDTVQTFTLQDVLGDSVPDMLKGIKDTQIKDLNDAINGVYLGDFLSYRRRPVADPESYTAQVYTEGKVTVRVSEDGSVAMTDEGKDWYEAVLTCDSKEAEHEHGVSCYGYVWYEKCENAEDGHDHSGEWQPTEDNEEGLYYVPTEGMMAKLAREKVGDMGKLDETVQKFTLEDVLGDSVPDMLKSIKDTQIKDLNAAINGMYLGDFLQYRRRPLAELTCNELDHYSTDVPTTGDEDAYEVKTDGTADIKRDGEHWYEAQLTCTDTTSEHEHNTACYGFVWYKKCELTEEHDHSGEWQPTKDNKDNDYYVIADGMMGKLADEKVDDLGNLNDTIQKFTLRDVMGENIPNSLTSLADVPLSGLGSAIDGMYLGAFLQYVKKPVNVAYYTDEVEGCDGKVKTNGTAYAMQDSDGKWYDAALNCIVDDAEHTHTLDCYRFNWYTLECTLPGEHTTDDTHTDDCYKAADKLIGRLSRLKVNELTGQQIIDTVNDTPLGDVLTLDNANGLLKELAEVKIGDLSSELDAIYVGIAMNYKRKEMAVSKDSLGLVVADETESRARKDKIYKDKSDPSKLYYYDTKHEIFYEAQLCCLHESEHAEGGHTFSCYGFVWYECSYPADTEGHEHGVDTEGDSYTCKIVVGLNGKLANLRIDELNGTHMSDLAKSLTIRDLMDSGMLDLQPDNIALLSIMFDKDCPKGCSFSDYLINGKGDPVTYWQNKHGSAPDDEHGLGWENELLVNFINSLLGMIKNISFPGFGG